jgi:hypothetical protein
MTKTEMIELGIDPTKPWKTGYSRGRPRKNEVRPPSPNAIAMQKYRSKYSEKYKAYNRKTQAGWVTKNRERNIENRLKRRAGLRQVKYFTTLEWMIDFEEIGARLGML